MAKAKRDDAKEKAKQMRIEAANLSKAAQMEYTQGLALNFQAAAVIEEVGDAHMKME
jgi:hypothetical protein